MGLVCGVGGGGGVPAWAMALTPHGDREGQCEVYVVYYGTWEDPGVRAGGFGPVGGFAEDRGHEELV